MVHLRKSVLSVGKHHSPDGVVDVTPQRLQHFANVFGRMKDKGLTVPVDWDHATDVKQAQPLSLGDYKKQRSAKNTVGKLDHVALSPDGNSLSITLDVEDKTAAAKAAANTVYISPVIFDKWTDGDGETFNDCFTHVDIVNWPVDHKQTPFETVTNTPPAIACAIRMGLSAPAWGKGAKRMATETEEPEVKEEAETPEVPETPDLGLPENNSIQKLVGLLSEFGITLDPATTPDNLPQHLEVAIRALLGAKAAEEPAPEAPAEDDDLGLPRDPQFQAMSLLAKSQRDERIKTQLNSLLESGRITPVEFREQSNACGALRLSLDKAGKPVVTDVEKFVKSREAIPSGTFFETAKTKATAVKPKVDTDSTGIRLSHGGHVELTNAEIEKQANGILGVK